MLGIHGGAFMLGSSSMVNADQIDDCLSRGWILLSLDHRLCPQVDIFAGPVTDCRDALAWVYDGGLEKALKGTEEGKQYEIDHDRVVAFGTSSGGTLALSLVSSEMLSLLSCRGLACPSLLPLFSSPPPPLSPLSLSSRSPNLRVAECHDTISDTPHTRSSDMIQTHNTNPYINLPNPRASPSPAPSPRS